MRIEREAIEIKCGILNKNPLYTRQAKAGYLWKRGKMLGAWSRRYFVIKEGSLWYVRPNLTEVLFANLLLSKTKASTTAHELF
jgi:hypothetical protein